MEITTFKIPYDIDILWDGGCEAGDLWDDRYGDEVMLLVSDSGSAYVCPEGSRNDWRIYVTPQGEAWRLPMTTDGRTQSEKPPWDASAKLGDILACGLGTAPDLEAVLQGLFDQSRPAPPMHLASVFSGHEVEASYGWTISFQGADILLNKDSSSNTAIYMRGIPFITFSRDVLDCGPAPSEWLIMEETCNEVRESYIPQEDDIRELFDEITEEPLDHSTPYERAAIGAARVVLEAGLATIAQIREFEAACKETREKS